MFVCVSTVSTGNLSTKFKLIQLEIADSFFWISKLRRVCYVQKFGKRFVFGTGKWRAADLEFWIQV